MSNILVYSGPGVSTSALAHTLRALESLCPTYDVRPTSAEELALAPWQETASLVVIPGGRDLPYVEEWSKLRIREGNGEGSSAGATAQDTVRNWVTQAGGAFLGICAGSYFASSTCTFEQGSPMEVIGARDGLKFYPGECRGTVYKGFVYESDEGARVVRLDTATQGKLAMHYNGGGAFIDADNAQGVEVLARYPIDDWDVAQMSVNGGETYAGQAAVVLCQADKGKALLFGTHPEFSLLPGSRPVRLREKDQDGDEGMADDERTAEQVAESHRKELIQEDYERRRYFGRCLATLGLRVLIPGQEEEHPASQKHAATSAELAAQGRLSPLYLVAASDASLQQTLKAIQEFSATTASSSEPLAHLTVSTGQGTLLTESSQGYLASTKDSNDVLHWYAAVSPAAQEALTACDGGFYPTEEEDTETVNLHKVPKYLIASSLTGSSPQRHWDSSLYFTSLQQARSALDEVPVEEIGSVIQYGERVTSTQTMLDKNPRLMRLLPSGFTSLATHQISGRGRGGNAWISPLGCLQFSTLLHIPVSPSSGSTQAYHHNLGSTPMAIGPKLVFVQYLAGLAIVQAIRAGLGAEYAEVGRKVRLKWPNDIYAEVEDGPGSEERKGVFKHLGKSWAKMGGILVNSQFEKGVWSLVVGCGINTLNPLPTTSLSALIDTYNAKHSSSPPLAHVSQERLAASILTTFSSLWSHFLLSGGWSPTLARLYRQYWLHSDQITTLTTLQPPLKVRIVGISSDNGTLRAVDLSSGGGGGGWGGAAEIRSEDEEGVIELQPDGNSFDMLKNLIKIKE
ncbi:class II aaRS and biotin synthetase [Microstroma glucosiphilum]|uniref:Class II aaRS and biotin synthetase n=1 Tax=Pseudomicrostroma glucosiphilum TaxID=1684307 RepID=A0A316UAN3_9BASI|nr:class II aaRS and biotin synthetase [Pseudomicrostroma glucosiphilum]PWN22267.1 class II aaRS and biotin synthetase [Pseudomicrostroma glucosiphilum]